MKFDDKKNAVDYLKTLCGEDAKIIEQGMCVIFQMPTKASLISALSGGSNEMKYADTYKAEYISDSGYWKVFGINLNRQWKQLV